MKQMCEWKTWKALHRALRRNGYRGEFSKISMRRWRNSASQLIGWVIPRDRHDKWSEKPWFWADALQFWTAVLTNASLMVGP